MEITGHQLLLFQEAAPSSATKFPMSDCAHRTDQAQWAVGFGVWLKAQPPWFGITQPKAAGGRECPAQDLQLLSQRVWGVCSKKKTPIGRGGCTRDRLGRQHLLPGKPRPASPTSLFLPFPLFPPFSPSCPRESHQGGGSCWELPGQAPKAATSAFPHTNQAPAGSGEHRQRQLHLWSSGTR